MKKILIILSLIALTTTNAMAGDLLKGKKIFKKCAVCHSLEAGKNKIGPHLFDLFGREAGSVEGYKYSKAMRNSGIIWNECTLRKFLLKPGKFVKKTKMKFRGIKSESQRDDLIAFILLGDDRGKFLHIIGPQSGTTLNDDQIKNEGITDLKDSQQ